MQVKVFESQDMASGLRMVRKELGPDALILSTRSIRNGKLGILGKSILEITAAIDDTKLTQTRTSTTQNTKCIPKSFAHHTYLQNETIPDTKTNPFAPNGLKEKIVALRSTINTAPSTITGGETHTSDQSGLQNDIADLKTMVKTLAGEVSRMKSTPAAPPVDASYSNQASASPNDQLYTILLQNGVSQKTSETIASFARESLSFLDLTNQETLIHFLHETIAGLIQISPQNYSHTTSQKRVALVGPTGVGKTTTLAKIAAKQISNSARSVAFITIDTYRIAAVEQLKVYGEIMQLPVDVVISPSQLEDALSRHSDKDLILIDTAGRSPRNHLCIEELAEFLKPEFNIEKNLVLSAVTRETELMDTIRQFSTLGIDKTIFTKIDECSSLGVLLNVQISNNSPLTCITNGQRVPEDIIDIDGDIVSRLIIPPIEGSVS